MKKCFLGVIYHLIPCEKMCFIHTQSEPVWQRVYWFWVKLECEPCCSMFIIYYLAPRKFILTILFNLLLEVWIDELQGRD